MNRTSCLFSAPKATASPAGVAHWLTSPGVRANDSGLGKTPPHLRDNDVRHWALKEALDKLMRIKINAKSVKVSWSYY